MIWKTCSVKTGEGISKPRGGAGIIELIPFQNASSQWDAKSCVDDVCKQLLY